MARKRKLRDRGKSRAEVANDVSGDSSEEEATRIVNIGRTLQLRRPSNAGEGCSHQPAVVPAAIEEGTGAGPPDAPIQEVRGFSAEEGWLYEGDRAFNVANGVWFTPSVSRCRRVGYRGRVGAFVRLPLFMCSCRM